MIQLLYIGLFGAAGAVTRYLVTRWVADWLGHWLPAGTFVVNMTGCFLIGALFQVTSTSDVISDQTRIYVGVGFLGGLTTFSTFGLETFAIIEKGQWGLAAVNVAANVVIGLIGVWAGMVVGRAALVSS